MKLMELASGTHFEFVEVEKREITHDVSAVADKTLLVKTNPV